MPNLQPFSMVLGVPWFYKKDSKPVTREPEPVKLVPVKARAKTKRRAWTEADLKKFKRIFPWKTNAELAKIFNRSAPAIADKALRMGLMKSPQFLASINHAKTEKARAKRIQQ